MVITPERTEGSWLFKRVIPEVSSTRTFPMSAKDFIVGAKNEELMVLIYESMANDSNGRAGDFALFGVIAKSDFEIFARHIRTDPNTAYALFEAAYPHWANTKNTHKDATYFVRPWRKKVMNLRITEGKSKLEETLNYDPHN